MTIDRLASSYLDRARERGPGVDPHRIAHLMALHPCGPAHGDLVDAILERAREAGMDVAHAGLEALQIGEQLQTGTVDVTSLVRELEALPLAERRRAAP